MNILNATSSFLHSTIHPSNVLSYQMNSLLHQKVPEKIFTPASLKWLPSPLETFLPSTPTL